VSVGNLLNNRELKMKLFKIVFLALMVWLTNTACLAQNVYPGSSIAPNATIPGNRGSVIPHGTTAQRPAAPLEATLRVNESTGYLEWYALSVWHAASPVWTGITSVDGSTSGTFKWAQPQQGASWKKVIIVCNGVTDAGTTITWTTPFTYMPAITNGTSLIIPSANLTTAHLVVPATVAETGTFVIEGFCIGLLIDYPHKIVPYETHNSHRRRR
jgi:hypothetical protein